MGRQRGLISVPDAARQLKVPIRFLQTLTQPADPAKRPLLPTVAQGSEACIELRVLKDMELDIAYLHQWAVREAQETMDALNNGTTLYTATTDGGLRELSRAELYDQELYLLEPTERVS